MKPAMTGAIVPLIALALAGAAYAGETHKKATKAANPRATVKSHIMVSPDETQWQGGPASLPPGAKAAVLEGDPKVEGALFTLRLKVPAGYTIKPHYHSADEHVTVISGELQMGLGEKFDPAEARAMPAGSFMVMPAKATHFALTKTETVVQIHAIGPWTITYVNPTDDPRKQARNY